MAFNLPGKISDPDRNQQSTVHAPAQGTAAQAAINFALKEKLNLLLLINDSDLMLEPGICGGLLSPFFLICRSAVGGRAFCSTECHYHQCFAVLKCSGPQHQFTRNAEHQRQGRATQKPGSAWNIPLTSLSRRCCWICAGKGLWGPHLPLSSPPWGVWNSAGSLDAAGDGSTDWALPVQRRGLGLGWTGCCVPDSYPS